MTTKTIAFGALAAIAAFAGTAAAAVNAQPGDIIFTTRESGDIRFVPSAGGASTTLFNDPSVGVRWAEIDFSPADNAFYVLDGRNMPVPNTTDSRLVRIDNLFGTPSATTLVQGNPLQNPIGLRYDNTTDRLLVVANPGSPTSSDHIEGIFSISRDGTTIDQVFDEIAFNGTNPSLPRYEAGAYITADPNSNDYWVVSVNGGTGLATEFPNRPASTLNRLRYNAGTDSFELDADNPAVDLSQGVNGLPRNYNNLRDVHALARPDGGTDLFFGDVDLDVFVRVSLDANDNFISSQELFSGRGPDLIEYDPFNDRFIFSENNRDIDDFTRIWAIDADGTNLTLLHTVDGEVGVGGLYIIPAPGAAGLLGLAGIAALRRRR